MLNTFWTEIWKINALNSKADKEHIDLLFRKRHTQRF